MMTQHPSDSDSGAPQDLMKKNIHTVHTIWNERLETDSSQSAQQMNQKYQPRV